MLSGPLEHAAAIDPDIAVVDVGGEACSVAARRYQLKPDPACLIRRDGYVVARWRFPDAGKINAARRRALGILA